jgi:hypothetical protein
VRALATLAVLAVLAACGRDAPPRPAATRPPPAPAAVDAAAPACGLAAVPARYPAPRRLVAIGDVHGDLAATRAALRAAGAVDAADRWIGGDLFVIQLGDVLDRGDDEQAIMDLFERLERDAAAAGGTFVWLLGNHELMNAAGDLRYVTPGGYADFTDVAGLDTSGLAGVADPMRARVAAFRPGGAYARVLAGQNTIAVVGDAVFSHAGVVGPWADRVDALNADARCWLAGTGAAPASVDAVDGPVWTRDYGLDPPDCDAARAALAALGARRMIVAHTPQLAGITRACDGAVWRVDVGLAAYYGGPIEVLELAPDREPRVLRGQRP